MLVSDIRAQLRDICVKVTCCHIVFACFICLYPSLCPQTDFLVHQVPEARKHGGIFSFS